MAARARDQSADPKPSDLERWRGGVDAILTRLETDFREERTTAAQHRSDLRTVIASQSAATQGLGSQLGHLIELFTGHQRDLALQEAEQKIMNNALAALTHDVANVEKKVEHIEPLTEWVGSMREQGIGARKLATFLWAVGGSIFGASVLALLQYIVTRPTLG